MQYKKATRVRHPQAPDWGLGEVLEDSASGLVRIFFVGVGEKKLSLKDLELEQVTDIHAAHPILDNLKISDDETLRYRTLAECIQRFLVDYPEGFYGQKFADNERDYKLKAHREMAELLNQDIFLQLISKGKYQEVYNRAMKHISAMNLLHLQEKLALRNGLHSSELKQGFAEALYSYLFGDALFEKRFNEFSNFLDGIKAGKWTIITFFSFTMFPDQHMFIKPTITNNAADICGFDIRYRPALNYATYAAVLKFSQVLKEALLDLKPRDMIDVQSFMWCIRPDKITKAPGKKKSKGT
jgi:hypothetical protein